MYKVYIIHIVTIAIAAPLVMYVMYNGYAKRQYTTYCYINTIVIVIVYI